MTTAKRRTEKRKRPGNSLKTKSQKRGQEKPTERERRGE